jgi:putative NADH-flavin reductase
MNIVVFGASGGIGRLVVDQLLHRGIVVTAVVRREGGIPRQDNLRIVAVTDLLRSNELVPHLKGADSVISAVGPRSLRDSGITAPITASITAAMHEAGVGRIVVVSAAPIGPVPPGETALLRFLLRPLIWSILGRHYRDLTAMEAALALSGLIWTAVRPPRLTDGPRTDRYRLRLGGSVPGGFSVSRDDVAAAFCAAACDLQMPSGPLGIAD